MTPLALEAILLPLRIDDSGVVRVGGTRVTLDTVVIAFQQGATADEITIKYPSLRLADVYAVISYYLNHQEQVARYLEKRDRDADRLRRQIEANPEARNIREWLLAHRTLDQA